jgi:hypothetical protein
MRLLFQQPAGNRASRGKPGGVAKALWADGRHRARNIRAGVNPMSGNAPAMKLW